jgi:hypothetical protein
MPASIAMPDSNTNLAVSITEIRPSIVAALVYDQQSYPDEIMKHVVGCSRMRGLRLDGPKGG